MANEIPLVNMSTGIPIVNASTGIPIVTSNTSGCSCCSPGISCNCSGTAITGYNITISGVQICAPLVEAGFTESQVNGSWFVPAGSYISFPGFSATSVPCTGAIIVAVSSVSPTQWIIYLTWTYSGGQLGIGLYNTINYGDGNDTRVFTTSPSATTIACTATVTLTNQETTGYCAALSFRATGGYNGTATVTPVL